MTEPCDLNVTGLQSVQEAQARIRDNLETIFRQETISFHSALGRVVSKEIVSQLDLPSATNAAMDGYAFNSLDRQTDAPFSLDCCGTSWAGKPYTDSVSAGQCIRIYTGAVLPNGADTVVMQERVQQQGNRVIFPTGIIAKDNIRRAGEDIKLGDILLTKGKKVTAIDQGLLAAAGVYQIPVFGKLRIGFLSTGDELVGIGQSLAIGQLYDSNRYTLSSLLADPAYVVSDLGRCRDDKQALKQLLLDAAEIHDVIITTGGASVGEADFIKEILDEIGQVNFWKIAMKPGKPLAFGKINSSCFFGLPGNPVSVIATFQQIVAPALRQLSGENTRNPIRLRAKCTSGLNKIPGRQEFQRGQLKQLDNGEFVVQTAGKQGSHILGSISRANCYIILPADCDGVAIDEWVTVEPFDRLI